MDSFSCLLIYIVFSCLCNISLPLYLSSLSYILLLFLLSIGFCQVKECAIKHLLNASMSSLSAVQFGFIRLALIEYNYFCCYITLRESFSILRNSISNTLDF